MGRRGHHEGTIYQRSDGRWEAKATLPDGTRKSLYGGTTAAVATRLRGLQENVTKGVMPSRDGIMLRDYLDDWLEDVRRSIEHSTVLSYTGYVKHIRAQIGSRRLSKLEVADVRALHEGMLAQGYAVSTIKVAHAVLHHALKDAMARGIIGRNVCELIRSPKAPKREMQPFTQGEARSLTKRNDRFHALWVVALATGMRFGELAALHWKDVNLTKGTLSVRFSTYFEKGVGMALKTPKTQSGIRTILLDPNVASVLKTHRATQLEERLHAGTAWIDNGLVFCDEVGRIYYHCRVYYQFKKALREGSLPDIHLHDLRHTAATLLLERGVNVKAISEMLGHANPTVTMTLYAHVTKPMQEQIAREMVDILFG